MYGENKAARQRWNGRRRRRSNDYSSHRSALLYLHTRSERMEFFPSNPSEMIESCAREHLPPSRISTDLYSGTKAKTHRFSGCDTVLATRQDTLRLTPSLRSRSQVLRRLTRWGRRNLCSLDLYINRNLARSSHWARSWLWMWYHQEPEWARARGNKSLVCESIV